MNSSLSRRHFSVAGLSMELESQLDEAFYFELPKPFESFHSSVTEPDLRLVISSRGAIASRGELVHDSGLNWRIRRHRDGPIFESYHPASGRLVATATAREDFRRYDVVFDEGTLSWLWEVSDSPMPRPLSVSLPYPLEQLLFVPALAKKGGFMVHACGAVLNGRALVFAGHSGDGKTSLSRLLAAEGAELLSDERIALRKQDDAFVAYGTPWPGEGNVVSPAFYPVGGIFLLRQATQHRLAREGSATQAAELLSRSIVPYYFSKETAHILELLHELVGSVPLHVLEFSLSPGLVPVLSRNL